MRYDKYPTRIFYPIAWATGIILAGGLAAVLTLELAPDIRAFLIGLIGAFALFSFGMLRYVVPHVWSRRWIFYASTPVHMLAIALADWLMHDVDLSPLYAIVIIIVAVIADRPAAFFAAALASGLQILVAWWVGDNLGLGVGGFLRASLYFVSAFVVGELAQALTERWRDAAYQAEQQRAEVEKRKNELEGLHRIAQAFENLQDPHATFQQITDCIADLLNAEMCVLLRFDETRSVLLGMPPGHGLTDAQIAPLVVPVDATTNTLWNVNEREYVWFDNPTNLPPPLREQSETLGVRQLIAARMLRRGHAVGVVFVANRRNGVLGEADARLLHIFAGQAAIAVENAELYREAQTTLRDVAQLYATSTELVKQSDRDAIPQRVVNLVAQALNAPIATIALLDDAGVLKFAGTLGVPAAALDVPFRPNGLGMSVAQNGVARFIEDITLVDGISPVSREWGFRAVACLPIQYGGKTLGVLYVNYAEPHVFSKIEQNILRTFANQTAVALENARLYNQVQEQARRDSLTQVYNHGYFLQRLTEEVGRALAAQTPLALIMLDIDHFKKYNDQYGHVVGDMVLQTIVQTIRAHIKHTDLVGRWGGEEFGIVLSETDAAGAVIVAERIRQTLKETKLLTITRHEIANPTVSQGIAIVPAHTQDTGELVDLADAALYHAKARGRDQVCVSAPHEG